MQPLPASDSVNSKDQLRKRESKNAYSRKWYADLTLEEKTARLERQQEKSKTPTRKESLRNAQRRHRDVQKRTLHPESIAMVNPLFTPELVWPTAGASGAHETTTNPVIGLSQSPVQHLFIFLRLKRRSMMKDVMSYCHAI